MIFANSLAGDFITHITLITHRFFPNYFGGVESYTLRLAQALQTRGHRVHILTGEPATKADCQITTRQDEVGGVPVTRLEYDFLRFPVTSRAAYSDPVFTAALQTTLAELRPDVVHALSLSLLMGGVVEAAGALALPLVYTATDYVLTCRRGTYVKPDYTICAIAENQADCAACLGPQSALERRLDRLWQMTPGAVRRPLLNLAEAVTGKHADFLHAGDAIAHRFAVVPYRRSRVDHVIAPSTYMRDMFLLNGFSAEKISVLHHGLVPPVEIPPKIPAGILRLSYIGRLTHIKGVHVLLEALAALPPAVLERVKLTLYGAADDPRDGYAQAVRQQARALPQVSFAGRVSHADLPHIYRQTDALIVPSVWPENCPVTVLEAQAHRTPVIGSRVGGIPDLIQHRVNGLLFEPGDVGGLADVLEQCVRQPEQITQLAAHSRIIKTLDDDVQAVLAVYRQVV